MTLINAHHQIYIQTNGPKLYNITFKIKNWLSGQKINNGLLTIFVQHTSCSLIIQENADPEVQRDLERFFQKIVPYGDSIFKHTTEGDDDMPAHVRSTLTQTSINIPIIDGDPALGIWQGIYLYEHRQYTHNRSIILHLIGE